VGFGRSSIIRRAYGFSRLRRSSTSRPGRARRLGVASCLLYSRGDQKPEGPMPSGARRTPEPDHGLVAMIRQGTFKERGSRDRSDRSPQSFHSRQNRPAWALRQLLVHAYIEKHGRHELTESSSGHRAVRHCRHANSPPHFDLIIATRGTLTSCGGRRRNRWTRHREAPRSRSGRSNNLTPRP
jgi:hypothetical protein